MARKSVQMCSRHPARASCPFKEPWDSGNRGELDIMYHLDIQYGHVEPVLGGYFFYESREWSEGDANVDNDVVGFGVEAAAILYPMKNPDKRDFTVGLMPYTRLGFGWQDGTFRNVPTSKPSPSGSMAWQPSTRLLSPPT